jgi:hypothetical protein
VWNMNASASHHDDPYGNEMKKLYTH